jgi:hypothetical protein
MYAEPELHADAVFGSASGVSLLLHVVTGPAPAASTAFPGHEHDGLQQSQ